jgi:hypothetical protein
VKTNYFMQAYRNDTEYWVADGQGMASRLKEIRAQRGQLGSFIVTLAYEHEKKE